MKAENSSGKLTFRRLLRGCALAAVFFGTAVSAETVTLAPGDNVTTNVPAFGGAVDVAVNTGTSGGGIVKMDPYNWYTGTTTLNCGTLWPAYLAPDMKSASSLGAGGALTLGIGTLKFDGGTGVFTPDVSTLGTQTRATVFDIAEGSDLTLAGKFTNTNGSFVKTGPGVLRIPGGNNVTNVISQKGGYTETTALKALVFNANGDAPTQGHSAFTVAEGTLVLGEDGGVFQIHGSSTDAYIGTMTVDPKTSSGVQEKSGVVEVRGGTVYFNNWLGIGAKNGFETTCPDAIPQSGLRVYGGTVHAKASCSLGRNKNSVPQYSEGTTFIRQKTAPFIEVHGGKLQLWNTSRISLCDDPGADSRIWVDGGTLYVCNSDSTTGAGMLVGGANEGDTTAPRNADVTVCSNGTFDVTEFFINGSRKYITANLNVLDGGIYRNNTLRKGNTDASCALNVLFDGGIAEIRYGAYADWIKSDVSKVEVGTRGLTLRSSSTCSSGVMDGINVTMTAKDTHPGEEPQGVTVTGVSAKNAGFYFTKTQSWAGPTTIARYGRCELSGAGAFPSASPVTLEAEGLLTVTNASQTFASFTIGSALAASSGKATLGLAKGVKITANAFAVKPGTALEFNLYETKGLTTALTTAGTYDLLTVPAADKSALDAVCSLPVCANAAAGTSYQFAVTASGETATLAVAVAAGETPKTRYESTAETGDRTETGAIAASQPLVFAAAAGTTLTVEGPVTGASPITVNDTTGMGRVNFGGALSGFTGSFNNLGGITELSALGFAASNPYAFQLGQGTVRYTGTGETIAGLVFNPGSGKVAILDVTNDLTLASLAQGPLSGAFWKTGAGDLVLEGNGSFTLGAVSVAYNNSRPQGITATGEGPDNGIVGGSVADGRLVIGTAGDAADAPNVSASGLAVGVRTAARDSGRYETAGEIVMNNGVLDCGSFILGYYNGYPETTPAGGLGPKFTQNGGVVNVSGEVRMMQDWEGNQTCSPVLEINGGEFRAGGRIAVGYQIATGKVDSISTVNVNGGLLKTTGNISMGCALSAAKGVMTIGNGTVECDAFEVGDSDGAGEQALYLNEGGLLKCRSIYHVGSNAPTGAGSASIYFRGGVWYPGFGRARAWGSDFPSSSLSGDKYRLGGVYAGAAGMIIDMSEWVKAGEDGTSLGMRNPVLHDPECPGVDGGLVIRGGSTVIMRPEASGCTFTGPVTVYGPSAIGVDNGWKDFLDKRIVAKAGSSVRLSGAVNYINDLTLGETSGAEPVRMDYCDSNTTGMVVSNNLDVLSPVTVAFHIGGGQSNVNGANDGTYDIFLYPASLDAQVPLERFIANPQIPEKAMTFNKEDVTSGDYVGWKKITVTISDAANIPGTTWTATAEGGAWSETANWDGSSAPNGKNAVANFEAGQAADVPVNADGAVTVGCVTLKGAEAAKGYRFTGTALNFDHTDFLNPPGVVAESGTHTFAGGIRTDVPYARDNTSTADGGRSGALIVNAKTGAKIAVTGPVTADPNREVYVNNPAKGGGTTMLAGPVTSASGVTVNSGTLEMDDLSNLNGKRLAIGPATFHYTGPDAATDSAITTQPGSNYVAAVVNIDNRLTVRGPFTAASGALIKRGPGELRLTYPGAVSLGYGGVSGSVSGIPGWNANNPWPENGDSLVSYLSPFYLDEGTVTVGGPNQTCTVGNNGSTDIFLGSQPRTGWTYSTDTVVFNFLDGTLSGGVLGLDHGMKRGATPTTGTDPCWFEYNQYGGTATFGPVYLGYELTKYDNHCRASFNLHGGTFKNTGLFRFGQTHCNEAGLNEPHATMNVHDGATFYESSSSWVNRIVYMSYAASLSDLQKHQNKSENATLNMYGGAFTNAYFFYAGCNGSVARINLHGGVLGCENLIRQPYVTGFSDNSTNRVYNVATGDAYVYWNGGEFRPYAAKLDPWASDERNATLDGLTEVLVSTNGAKISTAELKADRYTVKQSLLHDPALADAADGGFEKLGAGTLVLAGSNTYNGATLVSDGLLELSADADAAALPAGSLLDVATNAAVAFVAGTKAAAGGMRVDLAKGAGTITNLCPAAQGEFHVTSATGVTLRGLRLPITVVGATRAALLTRWPVYVDGAAEAVSGLCARVDNGGIVLGSPLGTMVVVK